MEFLRGRRENIGSSRKCGVMRRRKMMVVESQVSVPIAVPDCLML